jgi:hypothetical protein
VTVQSASSTQSLLTPLKASCGWGGTKEDDATSAHERDGRLDTAAAAVGVPRGLTLDTTSGTTANNAAAYSGSLGVSSAFGSSASHAVGADVKNGEHKRDAKVKGSDGERFGPADEAVDSDNTEGSRVDDDEEEEDVHVVNEGNGNELNELNEFDVLLNRTDVGGEGGGGGDDTTQLPGGKYSLANFDKGSFSMPNRRVDRSVGGHRGREHHRTGLQSVSSRFLVGGRHKVRQCEASGARHRRSATGGGIIFDCNNTGAFAFRTETPPAAAAIARVPQRVGVWSNAKYTQGNSDVQSGVDNPGQGGQDRRFSRSQSFAMLKHMYVNLKGESADGVDVGLGDDRTTPLMSASRVTGLAAMDEGMGHTQQLPASLNQTKSVRAGDKRAGRWPRSAAAVAGRAKARVGKTFRRVFRPSSRSSSAKAGNACVIAPVSADVDLVDGSRVGLCSGHMEVEEEWALSRCFPCLFPRKHAFEIRSTDRKVKSVRYNKHGRLVLGQHQSVKLRSESSEELFDWVRVLNSKGIVHTPQVV